MNDAVNIARGQKDTARRKAIDVVRWFMIYLFIPRSSQLIWPFWVHHTRPVHHVELTPTACAVPFRTYLASNHRVRHHTGGSNSCLWSRASESPPLRYPCLFIIRGCQNSRQKPSERLSAFKGSPKFASLFWQASQSLVSPAAICVDPTTLLPSQHLWRNTVAKWYRQKLSPSGKESLVQARARDDHKLLFIIKCGVLSCVDSVYISVAYCRADLIILRHETAFDSL